MASVGLVTENGWPQCSRDQCDTQLVPGTDHVRPEQYANDVDTVLIAWAAWFDRNVRNIEPPDGHRNWWGWSQTNTVWNSNHLSGTALDLCADELPWKTYTMPQNQVDIVHQGLALFESNVYWGRDWGAGDQDEMHFQIGYNTFGNPKFAEFAQRLRNGYLNLLGPQDPNAFPLPLGYYYGPFAGPTQSISGIAPSDSQAAKDGLGRWQAALGLPVTKQWADGATPQAATTLQLAKGWNPNPVIGGYGGVYQGEWDAVIRDGWRLPAGWKASSVLPPQPAYTKWGDYSQYQDAVIDDTYPYEVVCFRASIGNTIDTAFADNLAAARVMVNDGRLQLVIAYHFWIPGADNVGTFVKAIGKVTPELRYMIDVEDGGSKWNVHGDQSTGVFAMKSAMDSYFGNPYAGSLYWNPNANPDLISVAAIPSGTKMIIPAYNGPTGVPKVPAGVKVFGHQYADDEDTAPFGPTDINQALMPFDQFMAAWGTNGGVVAPTPVPDPVPEPTPTPTPPPTPDPTPTPEPQPVPVEPSIAAICAAIASQFEA